MADSTAADEAEPQISFTVKAADSKYALAFPVSATIADVKQKLAASEYADIPPERQRLIYSGRVLKDHDTVGTCKIKEGNTVHLVKGAESNSRQNPANQGGSTPAAAVPPGAGSPPASNVPSNIAAGTGTGNPLAQLTGARYAGFHGLPGMDSFGADGGMGAPPNPDQMLRLLEDPAFASQMNEAMNNPAVVDMLRNNPMIRNNPIARQAIENPEFRRMMMNPDMIRMQMQMQRAMEGMGGGAAGAQGGFPMPGQTDTTENAATDATAANTNTNTAPGTNTTANAHANPNPAANPFAALFPGAGGGAGAGGNFGAQPQEGAQNQDQNNPLAAMTQQLMQNPDMMRSMMQMMGGGGGGEAAAGGEAGAGGNAANPFGGFNPFMMGGMGDFGQQQPQQPAAPPDNRPPEERYEDQLRQLNDMGFFDFDRNVAALRRSGGSVQGAVEYLLSNL